MPTLQFSEAISDFPAKKKCEALRLLLVSGLWSGNNSSDALTYLGLELENALAVGHSDSLGLLLIAAALSDNPTSTARLKAELNAAAAANALSRCQVYIGSTYRCLADDTLRVVVAIANPPLGNPGQTVVCYERKSGQLPTPTVLYMPLEDFRVKFVGAS